MSLDLTKVAAQVGGMVARLRATAETNLKHLSYALEVLGQPVADLAPLQQKIASSRTTWLVAELVERPDRTYPRPPLPPEFTVLASDGSHIDVDRHRTPRCYLVNIGSVSLRYGPTPEASLESFPSLYSDDADLVITPPSGREQIIEGALLGIKRQVAECRQLAALAAGLPPGSPALALLDGSLILWGLEPYPEFVTETLLDRGFLSCLEAMRRRAGEGPLAVASYISFPRSTDVVNALRVAICPHQPPDCDRYCPGGREKDCAGVAGVRDRELFARLLKPGERSALFISPSKIQQRYGEHLVYFFYLNLDDEVARVEVPRWVATDEARLNLVHAALADQCRLGHGYPVALAEAHELAVVTGADRENFWQLVETSLVDEHLPATTSAKSRSKRTRWI